MKLIAPIIFSSLIYHQIEAKSKKKNWDNLTYGIDQTQSTERQCEAVNDLDNSFKKCRDYGREGTKSYKKSKGPVCQWSRQGKRCLQSGHKYDPNKYACDDIPKRRYCKKNLLCTWNHDQDSCEKLVITPCAGRKRWLCKNECQVQRGVVQDDGTKSYECKERPVEGFGYAGPQICIYATRDIHFMDSHSAYNIDFIVQTDTGEMCDIQIPMNGTTNDGSRFSCCSNTNGTPNSVRIQATSIDGFYGSFNIKRFESGALRMNEPLRYNTQYKFWIDGDATHAGCNNHQMCPLEIGY